MGDLVGRGPNPVAVPPDGTMLAPDRLGRRDFLVLVGGAAAVATGLSGCGDDDDDAASPSTSFPPVTVVDDEDPTFIVEFEVSGEGLRLAVKDVFDVAGVVTTAGCRAVADAAAPAAADAACLRGAREAGALIVGKANLTELTYDPLGVFGAYGIPVNPLDSSLIPGGSSSGSAVALVNGAADVAFGSDTAGSIRIPAACCGVAGLKTTHGRISREGVYPLAPTCDVVGPMARDIAGLITGMQLLEPAFTIADAPPRTVGRIRSLIAGRSAAPAIDAAIDRALAAAGFEVTDLDLQVAAEVGQAFSVVVLGEAARHNESLLSRRDLLLPQTVQAIERGLPYTDEDLDRARSVLAMWGSTVAQVLTSVDVLALPTLALSPPTLERARGDPLMQQTVIAHTFPWSAAGVPALALPVPLEPIPASLQLVGARGAEGLLLAAGGAVEAATRE